MESNELSRRDLLLALSGSVVGSALPILSKAAPLPLSFAQRVDKNSHDLATANAAKSPPKFVADLRGSKISPVPKLKPVIQRLHQPKPLRETFRSGGSGLKAALASANKKLDAIEKRQDATLERLARLDEEVRNLSDQYDALRELVTRQLRNRANVLDSIISQDNTLDTQWQDCSVYCNNVYMMFPKWSSNSLDAHMPILFAEEDRYSVFPGPSALALMTAYERMMNCDESTYGNCMSLLFPLNEIAPASGNFTKGYGRNYHHWRSMAGVDVRVMYRPQIIDEGRRNVKGILDMDLQYEGNQLIRPIRIEINTYGAT